jgi:hypothetical protein
LARRVLMALTGDGDTGDRPKATRFRVRSLTSETPRRSARPTWRCRRGKPRRQRHSDEPTSTPDRLPGRADLRIGRTKGGIPMLHGSTVEVARRLAPLGGRLPPANRRGRGTESPASLFGGASAAIRARSSALGPREGPWRGQNPMEDRASPGPATALDGVTVSSTEQGFEADPSLAIPRSGGNVDSGARASALIGNVRSRPPPLARRGGRTGNGTEATAAVTRYG